MARLAFVGQTVLSLLESMEDARVLDFGSGTGLFAVVASQRASLVVSVDRSLPMLRAGMTDPEGILEPIRRAGLDGPTGLVVRVAGDDRTATALRCRFDLVVAVAVLEYVDDCIRVLSGLAGTLRPGGQILVTVPNPRSPVRLGARAARPVLRARRPASARWAGQSYLLVRPNDDRPPWQEAARRAGLSVERVLPIPFSPSGMGSLLHPNLMIELRKE